jgi:hypothetical protein
MTKLTDRLAAAAMVFTATVALVALAEGAAALALKAEAKRHQPYMARYTDGIFRALYHGGDPDKYHRVVNESWGGEVRTDYAPFVEFAQVAREGRWVNVSPEGVRAAPGKQRPLAAPGPKVFVFGGSTTFGMGVADDETIPARLEQALATSGRPAAVYNLGVLAYYSTQERIAFEQLLTRGIVPDAAVFVDGLNDFYACQVPDRSGMSDRIEALTRERSRVSVAAELAARSNLVRLVRVLTGQLASGRAGANPLCTDPAQLDAVIRRLDNNRRMIAATARAFGVVPLFVQQPVPTYAYDNARRPVPPPDAAQLDAHRNSALGYPRLAAARDAGRLFGDNVLWLETLTIDANQYVDLVHYSPAYNQAIAERIAAALVGAWPVSGAPAAPAPGAGPSGRNPRP